MKQYELYFRGENSMAYNYYNGEKMEQNTIAAIATPPGMGAIAVVRLSGIQAYGVAEKVFMPKNKGINIEKCRGYTAHYGMFVKNGRQFDDGVALFFKAPHSFTGEDAVELSCHGGEAVSRMLLSACIEAGARPAEAGEFTRRAVMNGRMDLTQAEAVGEMISAESSQGVLAAHAAMEGALCRAMMEIKEELTAAAAHLAAWIDYPEEGVEVLEQDNMLEIVGGNAEKLGELVAGYDKGAIMRRGISAAVVGSPNVGKSTIFNLLSGFDHAIVTPVAGTTRDVVRQQIQIGGIILHLADTAGIHDTADVVEAEGIKRSEAELERAQLVIAVFDGSRPWGEEDKILAKKCINKKSLAIVNKSDLGVQLNTNKIGDYFTKVIVISARDAGHRRQIERAVLEILGTNELSADSAMLQNHRQLSAAVEARDALEETVRALQQDRAIDAAGVCLEAAIEKLDELTGENTSENIINEIFSRFCVGK